MDACYCELIMFIKSTKDADILRDSVAHNPHLHFDIRENLVYNIDNYKKEGRFSDDAESYFNDNHRRIYSSYNLAEMLDEAGVKQNWHRRFRPDGPFVPGIRQSENGWRENASEWEKYEFYNGKKALIKEQIRRHGSVEEAERVEEERKKRVAARKKRK